MAKNMTRKGIALGAAFALSTSALVSLPAGANIDPVTLTPSAGTLYAVTNDSNFSVSTRITTAAKSGGSETIKFRIVDADGKLTNAGIDLGNGSGGAANNALESGDDVLASFTDGVAVVNTSGSTAGTEYKLMLDPSAATSAFSVTVQAWVDFDGDNVIDTAAGSAEFASPVRTVTFHPASAVTWTVSFSAPALGDTSLVSTLTSSPELNVNQLASSLAVGYATYVASTGAYTAVDATTTVDGAGAFSAGASIDADGEYTDSIAAGGVVSAGTYVAQALYGSTEIGAAVFRVVGASKANSITTPVLVDTANTSDDDIRTNQSASFSVTVKDPDNKAVAGETVTFTFAENHSDTDAVISVGGKSLKNGDTAVKVTAVTDADGVATVAASFSGFAASANFMTVTAVVADVAANSSLQPDFVDTAAANVYNLDTTGTGAILKVTEGSSYTLNYSVLDNFGELLASSDYRVKLNDGGSVTKTAVASSGQVSISVTDDKDVAEVWTAQVQKYNASTAAWDNVAGVTAAITPIVGASNAASAVTLSGTDNWTGGTALALNLKALSNADTRLGQSLPVVGPDGTTDNAANNVVALSGVVTDASGAATYSNVTLSAPGVMFVTSNKSSVGSITVQTSAAGSFSGVKAYSNTSGKVTITAAAGAATKTLEVTFAAAAAGTGKTLTVNVVGAEPGKTMTVNGTLVDAYGNAVETGANGIKVTYAGPGFVVGSLPTVTDANGAYEFKVLLGANDVVTGSVTVIYAGANGVIGTGDDDLGVSKALAPAPVEQKVNAGSFKGYVAIYARGYEGDRLSAKVGNDWVVVPVITNNQENGTLFRVVEFTGAGYTINVPIYINRVLVDTITVTTK